MFEPVLQGLSLIVQWPAFGYLFLGVLIGIYFGAVPGLGGLIGMAILLPFTFGMDPASAFAFLLGMYAVTCTGDTLSCVLLGIPGTASSQATVVDGYPMAQKGEAARALGAAFTVSAVGGVLGAIALGLSIPIVRPLILSFASPEFLMLGILALTMVGSLSGGSVLKGLAAAAMGIMLSTIGYTATGGEPRFWLGTSYLLDGVPLIPLVLGLFALPELLALAISNTSISQVDQEAGRGGMVEGMRDALTHWWLVLRCTAIGVYIGMLPGIGGSVVDWVAYGHAVQSAKDKDGFGKGDVRGVIAPEAANNAMRGGALVPTIAFAIPGSASMAILLGAFLIHGLEPGPELLKSRLDITFSLVWTLVFANVLAAGLLLLWGNQIAKATFVKGHLIVPAVILFVFMGAWTNSNVIGDWITLILFGFVGYIMRLGGWPRPPLILGLILGPIMENALQLSVRIHEFEWVTRPIVLILAGLVVFTLYVSGRRAIKDRRVRAAAGATGPETPKVQTGDSAGGDPALSLPLAILLCICFAYGLSQSLGWSFTVGYFPTAAALPGLVFILLVIARDVIDLRRRRGKPPAVDRSQKAAELRRGMIFFAWILAVLLGAVAIGQQAALILFIVLYLMVWGGYGLKLALTYGAVCWVFLFVMFNEIVPVVWYGSWLGSAIDSLTG